MQAVGYAAGYAFIVGLGIGQAPWQATIVCAAYVLGALSHEAGHYLAAKQLDANPFWATDRLSVYSYPQTLTHQQIISLVGPISGLAVCLSIILICWPLADLFLTIMLTCLALAHLFTLVPFSQDGALVFMTRKEFYHVENN